MVLAEPIALIQVFIDYFSFLFASSAPQSLPRVGTLLAAAATPRRTEADPARESRDYCAWTTESPPDLPERRLSGRPIKGCT